MRQKISRDELLLRCANTFKRYGYHGTTMDALAAACELTKASFYYHYSNKESLLRDVLSWTHEQLASKLFAIAYKQNISAAEKLAQMNRRAKKVFREDSVGCLMGVISIDATYAASGLMPLIRSFFDDWAAALEQIFAEHMPAEQARELALQTVADYEGAILLARVYENPVYFDRAGARAASYL